MLDGALAKCVGVVVRRQAGQIDVDHQLKLRIANAIHTAMVYFMVSIPSVFIFNHPNSQYNLDIPRKCLYASLRSPTTALTWSTYAWWMILCRFCRACRTRRRASATR